MYILVYYSINIQTVNDAVVTDMQVNAPLGLLKQRFSIFFSAKDHLQDGRPHVLPLEY